MDEYERPPGITCVHEVLVDEVDCEKCAEIYSLSAAEVVARHAGELNWWAAKVMANYARLQAVERVAAELAELWDDENGFCCSKHARTAVHGLRALLTAAGPHQTGPENSNGETL